VDHPSTGVRIKWFRRKVHSYVHEAPARRDFQTLTRRSRMGCYGTERPQVAADLNVISVHGKLDAERRESQCRRDGEREALAPWPNPQAPDGEEGHHDQRDGQCC
jgi:hypothetical protein